MAKDIKDIQRTDVIEVDTEGGTIEIAPGVVQSVTTVVPSEADASSSPGPYRDDDGKPLDVNRPPVSTNRPNVPIAHSLVAGAGAPTGPPEYRPEDPPNPKDNPSAYVNDADRKAGNVVEMQADKSGNVTVDEPKAAK